METVELLISKQQKDKLRNLCVVTGDDPENYVALAQTLFNEAIDNANPDSL